jgi:hypothetical protein
VFTPFTMHGSPVEPLDRRSNATRGQMRARGIFACSRELRRYRPSSCKVLDWRPRSERAPVQSALPPQPHPPKPRSIHPSDLSRTRLSRDPDRHDAGHTTTPELGGAESSRQEHIRNELLALRGHNQEPARQRRHQGAVPGLHGQAGNVSRPDARAARPSLTDGQLPRPPGHRVRYVPRPAPHLPPLTSRCRHERCRRHEPQEGRHRASRQARLRDGRGGRQADWRDRLRHLRPVRIPWPTPGLVCNLTRI